MISSKVEVDRVFREHRSQALASLISALGDFDLAEDALQDAFAIAVEHWEENGIPKNPIGWLILTAKRRGIDQLRRKKVLHGKLDQIQIERGTTQAGVEEMIDLEYPDERLKLIFTTCHPAISLEGQIALTLRTLGGLSTDEIASGFLITKDAVAQRIVRTKRKLRTAKIPYRVPDPSRLADRVESVLAVLYLIFNEGYHASSGDVLLRPDLSREAIRLCKLLLNLMETQGYADFLPEVQGLLALMLLQDSRRMARVDQNGDLVLLEDQDRSRWDHDQIRTGLAVLKAARGANRLGPYQIQAAIAGVHAQAWSAEETEWRQIAQFYKLLSEYQPTAVVALNHAIAVAMADGPLNGLRILAGLDPEGELANYLPFHAAWADLLRRAGDQKRAVVAYEKALSLTKNKAEQRYFQRRVIELQGGRPD